MAVNMIGAAGAYANAARAGGAPGMEARAAGTGFSDMLGKALNESVGTLKQSEQVSLKGAAREADLLDVVNAVSNAEVTLQTVVAVRDKVVSAYQEIMRMPI
jgi:flagellar hook-basal body complex protein FliE